MVHVGTRGIDHIFVVRTWLEAADDARTMRGRIDHVASGARRYFANFGDLCDFIASAQALDAADPSDGERNGAGEAAEHSG